MNNDQLPENMEKAPRIRILILAALSCLALVILAVALFMEQIYSGSHNRTLVSQQNMRQIRIPASRGKIYSRDLMPLAENLPYFELLFYPNEMRSGKRYQTVRHILKSADVLSGAVGIPHNLTAESVLRHLNTRPGLPLKVFSGMESVQAAKAIEASRRINGAVVQPEEIRTYPGGRLACHLIGYTRQADPGKADDRKDFFYYLPDAVGVAGVEKAFDQLPEGVLFPGLRGAPGYSLIQVDNLGYQRRSLIDRIDPVNGNHVILTIDSRVQHLSEKLLQGYRGAMVAVDADNGDVIAAVSAPGYNLEKFARRITPRDYAALRDDKDNPLFNRALQGVYPPGSILKPLAALAYLKCGIDPLEKITCDGGTDVYGVKIRCASYRRGGHGVLDMVGALRYSCNDYMIEQVLKMDKEQLFRQLRFAGLGEKSGVGLPEAYGIFPSDALKRRRSGFGWNNYDTALLSIGQGLIGVTPLQAALFCAALANGGTVWKANLVSSVVDSAGNEVWRSSPKIKSRLDADKEALATVARGMFEVVNTSDGSGRRGRVDALEIFGKTGSAEYGSKNHLKVYAWFIAYAKVGTKTIATAWVVEDGDSGGTSCAPLAAEFYRGILPFY